MKSHLFVVAGLFAAMTTLAFDTNVAEAGRCCRARRACGYNYGCNTGYYTGCQNGCEVAACPVSPGGQLIAQPGSSAAAPAPPPAPAPQAEEVAPPPPEATPAPAPEGETGTD